MTLAFPGLCLIGAGLLLSQRFENTGFLVLCIGATLVLAGVFA